MARRIYMENYTLHKVRFRNSYSYKDLLSAFERRYTPWWLVNVTRKGIVVSNDADFDEVRRLVKSYNAEFSD